MSRRLSLKALHSVAITTMAALLLAGPSPALAQDGPGASQSVDVFVEQAPEDNSSKVYFPDEITPQSVAAARARAAEQQQLEQGAGADDEVAQLSQGGNDTRGVAQLSDGQSARALAQLTNEERQVLLEAVEGTDICDQVDNIPAIADLCKSRIETRSAEFAQSPEGGSAEDSLLGGGFDSARLATLEAAITRLARSSARAEALSEQAIASVALGQQATLSETDSIDPTADPTADLSPETQALVNAIVTHLGGN